MGSPFKACDVRLHLDWEPEIPAGDFQDLTSESPDGRYLALVRWHVPGDDPGFVVYTLDLVAHTVTTSPPQSGCCEKLWWENGFHWSAAA